MEDTLYHHGILGMHWGVRRTPAELGHDSPSKKEKKNSKKPKDMSDEELRQRINRLNLEKSYTDIEKQVRNSNTGVVKRLLGDAAENLARKALGVAVDKLINKISEEKDPNAALKKEIAYLKLLNDKKDQSEKLERSEEKFDINEWKNENVDKMSYETALKVSKWYEMKDNIVKEQNKETQNKATIQKKQNK